MDNNIWTIDKTGFYIYYDNIFGTTIKFPPSSIVNYEVDTNAKMLEFATNMKHYFENYDSYPHISFDE